MKKCCRCKEEKLESEFHKNKSKKDGLQLECKDCRKTNFNRDDRINYLKEYRINNKDKVSEQRNKWNIKNPHYYSEYHKSNYDLNRDRMLSYNRRWHSLNPERARERASKRRARLKNIPNYMPKEWWDILLLLYGYNCMNPECDSDINDDNPLTHDHVIPVTVKGSSHSIENSQILCKKCNSSKGTKTIDFRA